MTSMELRLHRGDIAPGRLTPVAAPVQELPWESLQAAQMAFDETPDERLGADEIEMILRWQSMGRNRVAGGDRSVRSTRLRLHTERLERRDVPTPVFAINLLGASLAPAIAEWNDQRSAQNAFVEPPCIAAGRNRTITVSLGAQFVAAGYLASARLAELGDEYRPRPNDSAIIELLATSVPSSRDLEPLAYCA